jgi:hypothetical protein
MLAVLVLAAPSLKGAASSMPDYPIAVASHDFSLSTCCLSSLFSAMFFFLFANLQSSQVLAWMLLTTQASSRDK